MPTINFTQCTEDTWQPTFVGTPSGRIGNRAVWTGSEMIIWGGFGKGYLNTGGRYCACSFPDKFNLITPPNASTEVPITNVLFDWEE